MSGGADDWTRRLVGAAADLVLARECAGCAGTGGSWCARCAATLAIEPFVAWPTPCPPGLPTPIAVAAYDGAVRAGLLAHKEGGRLALARPLGAALGAAVSFGVPASSAPVAHEVEARGALTDRSSPAGGRAGTLCLVPAPSRRSAVRSRGHDATLRLARAAAAELRRTGIAVDVLPVLRPTRRLADQAGLSADDRDANLRGGLRVPGGLIRLVTGRHVVVVDDVITSGATLAEAARALRAAGAEVVLAATVAATVRRTPPRRLRCPVDADSVTL